MESVLDRYPKLDFDSLANSTDAAAYDNVLDTTRAGITRLRQLLDRDPALRVIDEKPFFATVIVSTFDDALSRIARDLKV